MKQKTRKLFAIVMCLVMCIAAIPANAQSTLDKSSKLLYVVDSSLYDSFVDELNTPTIIIDTTKPIEYYENIDTSEAIGVDFSVFDLISSDVVTTEIISEYGAVALPKVSNNTLNLAREAYKRGLLVYVYGNLTVLEYKQIVGLDDFSINTLAYNSNETEAVSVKQWFDDEYERTEIFNIVSHNSNPLMCKFSSEIKQIHYLVAASNNFAGLQQNSIARTTILSSQFDFVNMMQKSR